MPPPGSSATAAVLARVRRRKRRLGSPSPLHLIYPPTPEAVGVAMDAIGRLHAATRKLTDADAHVVAWSAKYLTNVVKEEEEESLKEGIIRWATMHDNLGKLLVMLSTLQVNEKVEQPLRALLEAVCPVKAAGMLTPPASPVLGATRSMCDDEFSLRSQLMGASASLSPKAQPSMYRSVLNDRDRMRRTAIESNWLDLEPRVTYHAQNAADEADRLRLTGSNRLRYIRRGLVRRLRDEELMRAEARLRMLRKRKFSCLDIGDEGHILAVSDDCSMVSEDEEQENACERPSKRVRGIPVDPRAKLGLGVVRGRPALRAEQGVHSLSVPLLKRGRTMEESCISGYFAPPPLRHARSSESLPSVPYLPPSP